MQSGILLSSGSIYINHLPNSMQLRENDAFFFVGFLTDSTASLTGGLADAENDARKTRRGGSKFAPANLLLDYEIIVLLCDCLLQQLKPLTQVGKLKLQWICHNVFSPCFHCLLFFFLSLLSFHCYIGCVSLFLE
ncbi:hypothetical protein P5V15_014790 [Pogonomyrmex californicus]